MRSKHIEFICLSCNTKELIPKDVVDNFDLADFEGDLCFPPRFSCDNCPDGQMYPTHYESSRGINYTFDPISKKFSPPINEQKLKYL